MGNPFDFVIDAVIRGENIPIPNRFDARGVTPGIYGVLGGRNDLSFINKDVSSRDLGNNFNSVNGRST
jgi:hypothetical protein